MSLQALSVASECFPLIKTGGLADVVGALPNALAPHGVRVRTLLPAYRQVLARAGQVEPVLQLPDLFGADGRLLAAKNADGADLLLVDAPHLFDRPGGPYLDAAGLDWPDNAQRFAALSIVAARLGRGLLPGFQPDIVHAHDWQAGLVPAYLALFGGRRPATVMTVHNLAFQGQYPARLLDDLHLPASAFVPEGVEYYGQIGFLKAGLNYADRITTVSPSYAREIRTAEGGMGLDGLLNARAARLSGIVNGIDMDVWNPATDPLLAKNYAVGSLADRAENKTALCSRLGLDQDDSPLFCVITRLTWQKGVDLILQAAPHLLEAGGQLAVLGAGDVQLEGSYQRLTEQYPGRVACVFGYNEEFAHLLEAGSDAILVPSRFEPCGLTQLYALRYGCIPVVSRVGGLADTVIDANDAAQAAGVATGVQFHPVTADALKDAIYRTIALYRQPGLWAKMQRNGMTSDLGWEVRAGAYASLFRSLAQENGVAA
ncbi:glycogen synthase GlgA [Geminicoccus roseus]|uniref:glycogen synthase GlgA n=1 Tax=Geminicoccus roseus TaxID=404900 RepID=UPI000400244E|nr:glycogen synthase GlgA [Geminicoccus roseus]